MILETFSTIWQTIFGGHLKYVFDFLSRYLVTKIDAETGEIIHTGVISDFIVDLSSEKTPPIITTLLNTLSDFISTIIPADVTIFGLMVGSALFFFIVITIVRWIVGIFK